MSKCDKQKAKTYYKYKKNKQFMKTININSKTNDSLNATIGYSGKSINKLSDFTNTTYNVHQISVDVT